MTACNCHLCNTPGYLTPPPPMPHILDPLRNLLRRVARWGR